MASKRSEAPRNGERPPTQGRVMGRMQREYRYYRALLEDPRTPTPAKWLIGGGVGYLLLPFDLIPDFIPIIGKLDDMLIAPALIGLGMRLVPDAVKTEDRSRSRRVRIIYDDESPGPVLFESEALPGPFGVHISTCWRDTERLGPVLFPLLDLMFEYQLVTLTGNTQTSDPFDGYTMHAATDEEPQSSQIQTRLDVNFRPIPLVAAVMYYRSEPDDTELFVDTAAVYAALPPALRRQVGELRVRWQANAHIHLDAVLQTDGELTTSRDAAHAVAGSQFINLLIDEQCRIVDDDGTDSSQLLAELREFMFQDDFCYAHEPSVGDLVAWNPRRILRVPSAVASNAPRFVYPRQLSGTLLGH